MQSSAATACVLEARKRQYGPKVAQYGCRPLQDGPRWSQDGPIWPHVGLRWPQDGPRWPQDGPKMAPRWSKMAPRWPQDGPKMAQSMGRDRPRRNSRSGISIGAITLPRDGPNANRHLRKISARRAPEGGLPSPKLFLQSLQLRLY